VEAGSYTL
jgi:hypothetical protein